MMNPLPNPAAQERGITLIESLMVLGISAAFIAGGIALYGQANTSNQAREATSEILAIIASVQPTYSSRDSYNGLNNTGDDYGVKKSPWAGDYAVKAATVGAVANNVFTIYTTNVPSLACTQIKNNLGDLDGVAVGIGAAADAGDTVTEGVLANWQIDDSGNPGPGSSAPTYNPDGDCPDADTSILVVVAK